MKSFRLPVALLLIFAWLPASSHLLLEKFELIHQVHADQDQDSGASHEHNADNHAAADGKCARSSSAVKVPAPETVAIPLLLCFTGLPSASALHLDLQPSGLAPPESSSASLSSSWRFSFRAALPPRAPSFVS